MIHCTFNQSTTMLRHFTSWCDLDSGHFVSWCDAERIGIQLWKITKLTQRKWVYDIHNPTGSTAGCLSLHRLKCFIKLLRLAVKHIAMCKQWEYVRSTLHLSELLAVEKCDLEIAVLLIWILKTNDEVQFHQCRKINRNSSRFNYSTYPWDYSS